MEKKEPIKVQLSTVILLMIIILMGMIIGYLAIQNKNLQISKINNENRTEVQSETKTAGSTITNESNVLNTTNTVEKPATNVVENPTVANSTNNSSNANTKVDDKYKSITNKLNSNEKFYVTEVEKNKNEYTLKGVIYVPYSITANEYNSIISKGSMNYCGTNYVVKKDRDYGYALYEKNSKYPNRIDLVFRKENSIYYIENLTEFATEWKLTNDYRKITLNGEMICSSEYENKTVKKEFDDFKNKQLDPNNTHPNPVYEFEFKDGKCVKILKAETGH